MESPSKVLAVSNLHRSSSSSLATTTLSYMLMLSCLLSLSIKTGTIYLPTLPELLTPIMSSSSLSNEFSSNSTKLDDDEIQYFKSFNALANLTSSSFLPNKQHQRQKFVHVVVLVHGLIGNSNELLYLDKSLNMFWGLIGSLNDNNNNDSNNHKLIVHRITSNEGKTWDGIAAGGQRLAVEVNTLLKQVYQQHTTDNDDTIVTFSMVGYSLGGLYSRYALSQIDLLSYKNLHPTVFATIATPHLGVGQNQYIKVPRIAECVFAHLLGQTGLDLVHCDSNMIDQLTLDDKYLVPLQRFRHRRAYANAYNTDYWVATRTGAFLSETNSVHYPSQISNSVDGTVVSMIVQTPSRHRDDNKNVCTSSNHTCISSNVNTVSTQSTDGNKEQWLTVDDMAVRLDSLGWTKVFCDVRSSLAAVPIPSVVSSVFTQFQEQQPTVVIDTDDKKSYSSFNLFQSFGGNKGRWHIPYGHSVLIASMKSDYYEKTSSGGRPMVRQMATDLLQEILGMTATTSTKSNARVISKHDYTM